MASAESRVLIVGDPRLDGVAPQGAGALPRGGQRASGGGGADGDLERAFRGGSPGPGPRFDGRLPAHGYAWWYVDALSDDGEFGLTIIAFVGSVFSPNYFRARRRSPFADPLDHCAINVAVYGRGHRRWVLSEYPRTAVERRSEAMTIGGSKIAWEGSTLVVRFAERAAVSGRRVEGSLRLTPSATFDGPLQLDGNGRHFWWGVAPHSRVQVELRRPRSLRFNGHAYHDANFGSEPLEAGFSGWRWSRSRQEDRTIVLYDSHRRDGSEGRIARVFAADGRHYGLDAPQEVELGRSRWGVQRSTRCDAGGRAAIIRSLEDAPFYARSELRTELGGVGSSAVYESLDLDRFKRPLVQHMLGYKTRVERG